METPPLSPAPEEPQKNRTALYIAIAAVVLLCCCCIAAVALYYGYDSLGDPFGIYR
jgi:type VI protein secretion system component VasF